MDLPSCRKDQRGAEVTVKKVWKFPISRGTNHIVMPADAEVVHVDMQDNAPMLWALVDPAAKRKERCFRIYGTGHGIRDNAKHVGSWQKGPLVWHLFEILGEI